jgi:hypothetical protein
MRTTNVLLPLLLFTLLTFGFTNNSTAGNLKIRWATAGNLASSQIELASFKARVDNKQVQLVWVALHDIDNNLFTIERSTNGTDFVTVGTVSGSGNNQTMMTYDFNDEHPVYGNSYYRLKKTNQDGGYIYSKIVFVMINEK